LIYANVISLVFTVSAFIVFKNYRREKVRALWPKCKYAGLNFGFPLFIWDRASSISNHFLKKEGKRLHIKARLEKLMPLCTIQEAEEKFYADVIRTFLGTWLLVHMLAVIFGVLADETSVMTENRAVLRPSAGEAPYTAKIVMESPITGEKEIDIDVSPKLYTDEEMSRAFAKAKDYIMKNGLGANTDWMNIRERLNFIKTIPDTAISAKWTVGDYELIDDDGNIIKSEIRPEGESTSITVKLIYEDETEEIAIPVRLLPPIQTGEEKLLSALEKQILYEDKMGRTQDVLLLPENIDGQPLTWFIPKDNTEALVTGMGIFISVLCAAANAGKTKTGLKEREKQMILDYPDFVYKLVLLNGAGMGLKPSVEAMLKDAKLAGKDKRYVWQEVQAVLRAMSQGVSEIQAYELFGQRCAQLPYLKLSSLMVQSLKKGVGGINKMMSDAADEAVMMKREAAVKAGEEVGTKLLVPMGVLLMVVLIILVVPAFMTMGF